MMNIDHYRVKISDENSANGLCYKFNDPLSCTLQSKSLNPPPELTGDEHDRKVKKIKIKKRS